MTLTRPYARALGAGSEARLTLTQLGISAVEKKARRRVPRIIPMAELGQARVEYPMPAPAHTQTKTCARDPVRSAMRPQRGWATSPIAGSVAATMPTVVPERPTPSFR